MAAAFRKRSFVRQIVDAARASCVFAPEWVCGQTVLIKPGFARKCQRDQARNASWA
jgi:hypothetical protein